MDRACSISGRKGECMQDFGGRIILKESLEKYDWLDYSD
jgi:hypothetical protein